MDVPVLAGVIFALITIIGLIVFKSFLSPARLPKIKQLLANGKYEEAIPLLKKLVDKDRDNPINHYYLAEAYYQTKAYNLARSEYNFLFRFNLDRYNLSESSIRYKLADIYLTVNQTDEALKELLLIYNKNPDDLTTILEIADIFKNKAKWDHALNFYQKALKIEKDNPKAIFSIGEILYEKKQFSIAKKYLQTALKIAPGSPDAQYFYGVTCKETGDLRHSIIYLTKISDNQKFGLSGNFALGTVYYQLKEYENAIKYFQKALSFAEDKQSNSYLNILYIIADSFSKLNQIDKAIEHWEMIYAVKNTFKDVVIKLSKYQHLKNDDNIKELLTASNATFEEIAKDIVHFFDCKIIKMEIKGNGKSAEAQTIGSTSGWKKIDKLPVFFLIYRDISRPINQEMVSDVLTKMKFTKSAKAYIIAPSYALPEVNELSNQRPIEIINRDEFSRILKEIFADKKNRSPL